LTSVLEDCKDAAGVAEISLRNFPFVHRVFARHFLGQYYAQFSVRDINWWSNGSFKYFDFTDKISWVCMKKKST